MEKANIGFKAGIIFEKLGEPGLITIAELARRLNFAADETALAAGGLARENKIYIEGLTEKQVRQKLSHSKIIRTNRFGVNSCLYYILFEDVKGRYLCLFNSDKECFRALFFNYILLN